MPGPFGHEYSGIVAEAGKGAPFKAGDEVMGVHSAPCLKCGFCKEGKYNLCEKIMDTKVMGAFAEYILIPAHVAGQNVYKKPRNLSFEEAAFLEPLSCVVHGMAGLNIKKGNTALVLGAGPIGLLHMLLLSLKGVKTIIADPIAAKRAMARKLGGTAVSPSELSLSAKKAGGFDFVFECTGIKQVWEEAPSYAKKGGIIILFGGLPGGATAVFDSAMLHYGELTLTGVFHFTPRDVREAYGILKAGHMNVKGLISGRVPLKDIGGAFEKLRGGKGIKYAIIP